MKKTVYAISDETGMFRELKLIDNSFVINDHDENDDGVFILEYKEKGEILIEFYIDSMSI